MEGAEGEAPCECSYLRAELARRDAQLATRDAQIASLTRTAEDQAHSIAELTGAEPGAAPAVACVYWLYAPTKWNAKSWRHAWNRITPFLAEFGDAGAHEITPLLWERYRERKKGELTRYGSPPSDATMNLALFQIKAMLSWAVRHGMIKRNPLDGAKAEKTKGHRETRVSPDDIETLLVAADDLIDGRVSAGDDDGQIAAMFSAFVLCQFDSMMRFEEARNIQRPRIGPGGEYRLYGAETKTNASSTKVLTPRTLEAIGKIRPVPGVPYVFASHRTGKLISDGTIRNWFRIACQRTGIDLLAAPGEKRVRMHDLRASGATAADMAGARAKAIQAALGHASLRHTETYLRSHHVEDAHEISKVMQKVSADRRGPQRAPKEKRTKLKHAIDSVTGKPVL